ncbi:hypothetical protein [Marinococcus luteus]|uniref:hypothetical protein n=1 Tax=Marinococcus luteus TaxID=1122204 RepID=UPI002ACCF99D|nr:hypothetical protein [Marinococcus luteus]MDZ5782118.1 hypothetical protein [Marinococcus luteus]
MSLKTPNSIQDASSVRHIDGDIRDLLFDPDKVQDDIEDLVDNEIDQFLESARRRRLLFAIEGLMDVLVQNETSLDEVLNDKAAREDIFQSETGVEILATASTGRSVLRDNETALDELLNSTEILESNISIPAFRTLLLTVPEIWEEGEALQRLFDEMTLRDTEDGATIELNNRRLVFEKDGSDSSLRAEVSVDLTGIDSLAFTYNFDGGDTLLDLFVNVDGEQAFENTTPTDTDDTDETIDVSDYSGECVIQFDIEDGSTYGQDYTAEFYNIVLS